jgi:electron transport complex protein RnfB
MTGLLLTTAIFMSVLGVLLGLALAIASRKWHVQEDPRIDAVDDLLPHANCGACGFPGCRAFAEAAVQGKVAPSGCTVNSKAGTAAVAAVLGVDAGSREKTRRPPRLRRRQTRRPHARRL